MKTLILALLFLVSAKAINLQKFHFSNSPVFATVEDAILDDGFITTDYKYILVTSYNYVESPLVRIDNDNRLNSEIEWMNTLNLGGAYKLSSEFQVGMSTFITNEKAIAENASGYETKNVLGDTTIDFKYKFFEKNRLAIAFVPKLYLPTGDEKFYTSNDKVGSFIGFALEKAFSHFEVAVNIGHKDNHGALYDVIDHREQFHFSIGALKPVSDKLDLTAEFFRDFPYDSHNQQSPSEFNLGLRYSPWTNKAIFAGVGSGSFNNEEATDMRIFAGIKFFPNQKKKSPKVVKEEKKYGIFYKLFNVYFETNNSRIQETEKEKLHFMIDKFKEDPYLTKIVIEGYSSSIGNKNYNMRLSDKRAQAVKEFLIEKGIAPEIIEVVGHGSSEASKETLDSGMDRKVMFRLYRSR